MTLSVAFASLRRTISGSPDAPPARRRHKHARRGQGVVPGGKRSSSMAAVSHCLPRRGVLGWTYDSTLRGLMDGWGEKSLWCIYICLDLDESGRDYPFLPSVIFGTTGNDGCSNSQIRAEFVTSSDRRGICCRGSTSQRHADAGCKYVHSKKKNKCDQAGQLECKYVPGLNVREWGKWVWCKGVAERMTHFPICFHFLVFFLFQISVWNIQIQT